MRKERFYFLQLMYAQLTDAGVEVRLEHNVFDGDTALFNEYGNILGLYEEDLIRVDTAHPDWFETYVHEFMHFRQDVLQTTAWRNFYDFDYDYDEDAVLALGFAEYEAEQMVLITNRMFNLGIDENQYEEAALEVLEKYGVQCDEL